MMDFIIQQLTVFDGLDYAVLAFNLALFLFARAIVDIVRPSSDETVLGTRVYTLRAVNVLLFVLYFSAVLFADLSKQLSQTGLMLLVGILLYHVVANQIERRYGRVREIDGVEYHTETYQSEMFSLLTLILTGIVVILVVINIWGMTGWLKATSVLGGLLIVLFSTKDFWAPDNIHGLIILYNGDIEPGTLIEVDELGLLAIVIQTTLTQTRLRDLRSKHIIIVPNAKLRGCKVEILSRTSSKGLMRTSEFQIGYGIDAGRVDEVFHRIWETACEREKSINDEKPAVAQVAQTGDHGVTWRLCYWVRNSYGLIDAEHAINRAAYEVASEEKIGLNTPLTHNIAMVEHGNAAGAANIST